MERSAELDTLRERCAAVEQQVQELEGLGARLADAQRQAERLAAAGEEMDRIQGSMGDLGQKVEGALLCREDVERVLSMSLEASQGHERTPAGSGAYDRRSRLPVGRKYSHP